jgi:translocator protein
MMPSDPFWAAILAGAAFCVVLAVAGGLLTRLTPWYHGLRQPPWKPPDWAFGPIWTVVFICLTLAIGYAWIATAPEQRGVLLAALAVNGALNIAWSGIFFVMQNPFAALLELLVFWLSIVVVVWLFADASRTAALLALPYLLWVTTAGVLNLQIVRLNR